MITVSADGVEEEFEYVGNMTLRALKERFVNSRGKKWYKCCFLFHEKDYNKTLEQRGIRDGESLSATIHEDEKVSFTINRLDGSSLDFEADIDEPLELVLEGRPDLKSSTLALVKDGVPLDNFPLYRTWRNISGPKTLMEAGGDTFPVQVNERTFQVKGDDAVQSLFDRMIKATDRTENNCLVLNRQSLELDKTLDFYRVKENTVVSLFPNKGDFDCAIKDNKRFAYPFGGSGHCNGLNLDCINRIFAEGVSTGHLIKQIRESGICSPSLFDSKEEKARNLPSFDIFKADKDKLLQLYDKYVLVDVMLAYDSIPASSVLSNFLAAVEKSVSLRYLRWELNDKSEAELKSYKDQLGKGNVHLCAFVTEREFEPVDQSQAEKEFKEMKEWCGKVSPSISEALRSSASSPSALVSLPPSSSSGSSSASPSSSFNPLIIGSVTVFLVLAFLAALVRRKRPKAKQLVGSGFDKEQVA